MITDPLTDELFPQALHPIMLRGQGDQEGFRRAARALLAQQVSPAQVSWHCSDDPAHDLRTAPADRPPAPSDTPMVAVPPEFVALCESAILHADPRRFGLLYRLLWRLVHEPGLRHNPLDADRVELMQMAQAVRDEMHKLKAFVRFHRVQDDSFRSHPEGGPLHVAWVDPEHHTAAALAVFFARRFAQMRWALLSPQGSAQWDGARLQFGPGLHKADAPPADAGEKRWLACYQHTFMPIRRMTRPLPQALPHRSRRQLPETGRTHAPASTAHPRHHPLAAQPATRLASRQPHNRAALAVPAPPQHPPTQLSFDEAGGSQASAQPPHLQRYLFDS